MSVRLSGIALVLCIGFRLSSPAMSLVAVDSSARESNGSPNILWIFVEDLNPLMSCYGVEENPTPTLDFLAGNGILFEQAFAPSPVCSPTRSALITGRMPTSIGVHNHHSSRTVESGLFLDADTLPERFRKAGYFTFNHGKDDYNFIYNRDALYTGETRLQYWYTFQGTGSWRDPRRAPAQPFFGQIQLNGGKHGLSPIPEFKLPMDQRLSPGSVSLPPYLPDIPEVRTDWERHYDCARVTDREVEAILKQLEEDGLLENTIIFFFSDHGYKGYRHKQHCYDGGLHVPLILAQITQGKRSFPVGLRRSGVVSLLDVSATTLSLAGIPVPEDFESIDLLRPGYHRDFVVSTRDRCDFTIDRVRTVRTADYRYIRNFMPERPYHQPSYHSNRPEIAAIRELSNSGQLDAIQAFWWGNEKPVEELYDVRNDPHQAFNLVSDPAHSEALMTLRNLLEQWIVDTGDLGQFSETATLNGIENLRFVHSRWGDRCVNPEYGFLRYGSIPESPAPMR